MKTKIIKSSSMEPQASPVYPLETVKRLSNKFTYYESNTLQQNVVWFTRSLYVSKNQTDHLENITKEQASSKLWMEEH